MGDEVETQATSGTLNDEPQSNQIEQERVEPSKPGSDHNPQAKKDWIPLADFILKCVTGILIPIAILFVGNQLVVQQQRSASERLSQDRENERKRLDQQRELDLAQRKADRVTDFLTHVSSSNPKERLLAIRVLQFLAQKDQFPSELLPLVVDGVNDPDREFARQSSVTLIQAARTNEDAAKSVVQAAKSNLNTAALFFRASQSNPDMAQIMLHELAHIFMTKVKFSSAPAGAKVYVVPIAEADKVGLSPSLGTTPFASNFVRGVYLVVFEHDGKRIRRQVDLFDLSGDHVSVVF